MKPALLVIDMQKEYCKGYSKESMDKAAAHINAAADLFRKKELPVVWITNDKDTGNFKEPGGWELIDSLKPRENETRVYKRYKNSFNKTGLLAYLNDNAVDTVIVTGYSAAYCVLSTYRAAEDFDLRALLLRRATAADAAESVRFVEGISEVITMKVLEMLLGQSA